MDRRGLPVRSILQVVEPPRRIGWTGQSPGLRARHVWTLEPDGDGVVVETRESFAGWLARLMPGAMSGIISRALDQGLAALAEESERRAVVQPDGI